MSKPTKVDGRRRVSLKKDEPHIEAAEPDFALQMAARFSQGSHDRNVVLSIPTWGWTGDGKTCALLTALHYCEVPDQPIGLAMINDVSELEALEASTDEYKGMSLAATAASTTPKLRALYEEFIDKCRWPPGTDEATPYVLALKGPRSTIGYAVFPDLKGGSFRESDESARIVIAGAHACMVLVNPELYGQRGTEGKRYRDEVASVVQRLAEAGVPVCVMITKADNFCDDKRSIIDKVQNSLTILAGGVDGAPVRIFRVSVIDDTKARDNGEGPPAADERKPKQLLAAWTWAVGHALAKPSDAIRGRRPPLQLRGGDMARAVQTTALPELRRVGDYSGSLGRVLCSMGGTKPSFAFLSEDGELVETTLQTDGDEDPATRTLGQVVGLDAAAELHAEVRRSEMIFGARTGANALWTYSATQGVRRTTLPFEVRTWSMVTSKRLVVVDAAGRLSSLHLDEEKWRQVDHLEGFVPSPSLARCVSIEAMPTILVADGAAVHGVDLDEDGRFGARVVPSLKIGYDENACELSPAGVAAAARSSSELVVARGAQQLVVGTLGPVARRFALAPQSPVVAWVDAELKLTAASFSTDDVVRTAADLDTPVGDGVTGMAWARDASALAVSFADGTWQLFRTLGVGRGR